MTDSIHISGDGRFPVTWDEQLHRASKEVRAAMSGVAQAATGEQDLLQLAFENDPEAVCIVVHGLQEASRFRELPKQLKVWSKHARVEVGGVTVEHEHKVRRENVMRMLQDIRNLLIQFKEWSDQAWNEIGSITLQHEQTARRENVMCILQTLSASNPECRQATDWLDVVQYHRDDDLIAGERLYDRYEDDLKKLGRRFFASHSNRNCLIDDAIGETWKEVIRCLDQAETFRIDFIGTLITFHHRSCIRVHRIDLKGKGPVFNNEIDDERKAKKLLKARQKIRYFSNGQYKPVGLEGIVDPAPSNPARAAELSDLIAFVLGDLKLADRELIGLWLLELDFKAIARLELIFQGVAERGLDFEEIARLLELDFGKIDQKLERAAAKARKKWSRLKRLLRIRHDPGGNQGNQY